MLCLVLIGLWPGAQPAQARGESPYCSSLKAQIARAGDGGGGRFRAAAAKQRAELNRAAAYARGIGCDRQQFLIFGEAPPPQCGQLQARIAQMSANLANLQQSEGGGGNRAALLARYDAECRDRPPPPQEKNILEELFGSNEPARRERAPPPPAPSREDVRDPFDEFRPNGDFAEERPEEKPRGGSEAICVRQCDGGFFPVTYSARSSDLEHLNDLCRALCPNTEARLYTKSPWRDVDTAVSMDGESYADHPNALKFQKQRIAGCGCLPPGKSWAESLEEAERLLAESNGHDQMVTAEEAERLSRPIPAGAVSRRDPKNRSTRRDAPPLQTATTVPPAESAPSAVSVGAPEPSVFREFTGPDGVRRRVRVIAPTL